MFKKLALLSIIGAISMGMLSGCGSNSQEIKRVGVLQLVQHPALDSTREGFVEGLKKEGFEDGKNIKLDIQNAQGDIPTTQTIAHKFVTDKDDLIFAIATPAVQASKNATKDIPIVFSAVTDPVKSDLLKDINKPEGNITGTSDFQDIDKTLDVIQNVLPKAKKIGAIFNTSEINSKIQIESLKKEASKRHFEVEEIGVSSTNEIAQAVNTLAKKNDLIFTPTDNLMASSMPLIVQTAMKDKKPVIGSEEAHVKSGALAANSLSFREIGIKAGEMAGKILKGEKISNIPVGFTKDARTVVNEKTKNDLGIKIDSSVKFETIK